MGHGLQIGLGVNCRETKSRRCFSYYNATGGRIKFGGKFGVFWDRKDGSEADPEARPTYMYDIKIV